MIRKRVFSLDVTRVSELPVLLDNWRVSLSERSETAEAKRNKYSGDFFTFRFMKWVYGHYSRKKLRYILVMF